MKRFFACCISVVLIMMCAVSCAQPRSYETNYETSEDMSEDYKDKETTEEPSKSTEDMGNSEVSDESTEDAKETETSEVFEEETSSTVADTDVSEDVFYITEADIEIGQYVKFGSYEQDDVRENGQEPIEWLVLDIDDGMAVLISRYGLDCKPYNNNLESTTWENCSLRKWLNEDFYETAFNYDEQLKIETAYLSNYGDIIDGTNGGNDTKDKVFLLNKEEAKAFFGEETAYFDTQYGENYLCNKKMALSPTKYAIDEGVLAEKNNQWYNGNCVWWLRDVGQDSYNAAICNSVGSIYEQGAYVSTKEFAVRPVVLVNIEFEKKPIADNHILNVKADDITPGDFYTFGYYEQDCEFENGSEQIEWEVLDVQDGKALLTTVRGIMGSQYGEAGNNAWESSYLRSWLNGDFYQSAFDSREKRFITNTDGDNVFVLSVEEARKYYPDEYEYENAERTIRPTLYGQLTGIYAYENDKWYSMNCSWWLRTAGIDGCAAVVNIFGCIDETGDSVESIYAVRPAIWVDLSLNY